MIYKHKQNWYDCKRKRFLAPIILGVEGPQRFNVIKACMAPNGYIKPITETAAEYDTREMAADEEFILVTPPWNMDTQIHRGSWLYDGTHHMKILDIDPDDRSVRYALYTHDGLVITESATGDLGAMCQQIDEHTVLICDEMDLPWYDHEAEELTLDEDDEVIDAEASIIDDLGVFGEKGEKVTNQFEVD